MPVAFETLRLGRPLQPWGRANLLGPTPADPNRTGLIYRQIDDNDGLAYGGNLEVTPPLPNHPLGRIVVGTMPAAQTTFLARQQVQGPLIELNTNWLLVGHIDEFMAFASVGPTPAWQVVWSDPLWGMNLLNSVPAEEPLFYDSPTTELMFGTATGGSANTLLDDTPGVDFTTGPAWQFVRIYDGPGARQIAEIVDRTPNTLTIGTVWRFEHVEELENAILGGLTAVTRRFGSWFAGNEPQGGSRYAVVTGAKMWSMIDPQISDFVDVPALITAGELDVDSRLAVRSNAAWNNIVLAQSALNPALAGSGGFTNFVPALYLGDPDSARSMFAYIPGLVNFQEWNGQLWMPRPFGPRVSGKDVFETAVENAFGAANVHFIDNWDTYHRLFGEVHCGTNVIRDPPAEYQQWWENAP